MRPVPSDNELMEGEPVARIPLGFLTIRAASEASEDRGLFYVHTMPAILERWTQLTYSDYWSLTVDEHQAFYDWLTGDQS